MVSHADVAHLKNQLESEQFPVPDKDKTVFYRQLPRDERQRLLTERIKKYGQKVYRRVADKPITQTKVAGICQRENPFYIDTVRAFRDRRYEYKGLVKKWKKNLDKAMASNDPVAIQEAKNMIILYVACNFMVIYRAK